MDKITCKDLKCFAKSLGLKGYSRMNKNELVKFCMKSSLKYSGEEGIEDLNETINGIHFFRKYIYEGEMGKNELRIARILKLNPHPNIVSIYDIGPDYIDMELLTVKRSLKLDKLSIRALKDAKEFLHSLGLVYLDWKLDNLGVGNDGNIKIFDFDMSSSFIGSTFTETPGIKGYLWKGAEKAGLKNPIEIDNWIFAQMIKDNN